MVQVPRTEEPSVTAILEDLRYSLRALAKRPVYALVTVLVLSLAVGANTTVFSISNGFFMRPLPYPDGDRLVAVFNAYPGAGLESTANSIPDYLDRRDRVPSLEQIAIVSNTARTLSVDESPERLTLARVSPSFFDVFSGAADARAWVYRRGSGTRERARHRTEQQALVDALRRK
jgi:hypothetical protein